MKKAAGKFPCLPHFFAVLTMDGPLHCLDQLHHRDHCQASAIDAP